MIIGMENMVVGFWPIFKAGLIHSVNPVAVTAWVVFLIYFLRFRKAYGSRIIWPGTLFLAFFFVIQGLIHLGFADFFYIFVPGFAAAWDVLRIFLAAIVTFIGLRITLFLFQKSSSDFFDLFRTIVYWKLALGGMEGRSKGYRGFVLSTKIVFWALIFSFFNGPQPLPRELIQLLYSQPMGLAQYFLIKIALFEAMTLIPFLVIFVLMAQALSGHAFLKKIVFARGSMLVFSGICLIGGIGTLAYYILAFVF